MAALMGFFALGEMPGVQALAGIVLICAGLLLLGFEGPGGRLALSTLAAYGVRLAGDWLPFTLCLVTFDSTTFVAYALVTRRGGVLRAWTSAWRRMLVSGALGIVSFGVFMWALGKAPVGQVSALRETSVLFAAMIGAAFLGELATWKHYAAAAAVVIGVGVIALGG